MKSLNEEEWSEEIYSTWHSPTTGDNLRQSVLDAISVVLKVDPRETQLGLDHYIDPDSINAVYDPEEKSEGYTYGQIRFQMYGIIEVRVCANGSIQIGGDADRARLFGKLLENGDMNPEDEPIWRGLEDEKRKIEVSVR